MSDDSLIGAARVLHGDMRERLAELGADSIDAIVTDPPYHLTTGKKGGSGIASLNTDSPAGRSRIGTGFMGMAWDGGDVALRPETWAAALRVAKPGAHLVAFGGTRTFHRIWCAIEDAGWEIRDTLMWLYGTGFPKSSNQGGEWEGWGTALKPAFEPIVLARKPLIGTVPANLQQHRTGALNIDGCRIGFDSEADRASAFPAGRVTSHGAGSLAGPGAAQEVGRSEFAARQAAGRWPANVLHDGSDEVVALFPDSAGQLAKESSSSSSRKTQNVYGAMSRGSAGREPRGDSGSAARFFWCPKATRADRNDGLEGMPRRAPNWSSGEQNPGSFQAEGTDRYAENYHPTVKPTELMRWLCRLVTPPGGTVLDPFMGSGSTGKAALLEGFGFVGIEQDAAYLEIACARLRAAQRQPSLFAAL